MAALALEVGPAHERGRRFGLRGLGFELDAGDGEGGEEAAPAERARLVLGHTLRKAKERTRGRKRAESKEE